MAASWSSVLQVLAGLPLLGVSLDSWPVYLAAVALALTLVLFACWHWPIFFLHGWPIRLFCWLFYPVRALGTENVPLKGPALLVCNHVSYLDWVIVLVACPRYVRWVIFVSWLRRFGLGHFVRRGRVIAIDAWGGPKSIRQSLTATAQALAEGDLVGIFAEARFTRTGHLLPFHRGLERILEEYPAPIIPVYIDGLWGSIWSFYRGKLFWKWPRKFRPRPLVAFGKPLPPSKPAPEVRQAVQRLAAECSVERARTALPVHRQFVRRAARHPFRPCMYDSATGTKLNYGKALAGAWCLANLLRPMLGEESMVGVWLPSSVGGAITNVALAFLGKTPVNLNYTASIDAVRSAIRQCGIRHVLTSERFIEVKPLDLGPDVELVVLDKYRPYFTLWRRLSRFLAVILLPGRLLDRWVLRLGQHTTADLATVIFSSGSTGEPKGVMLTHANVAANAASVLDVVEVEASDRLLGILPFFHSFGYTVTLWVPLVAGASLVYHPDPRQAKMIGELCRTHRCTIFLATPTFLRFCLRQCNPEDFATLRLLICGAEKLPQPLACDFHKKFGVLPLEGYGCTETSPVAATNVPDRELEGFKQVGHRPGTIGQPIPGVAFRIVDPETWADVPLGAEGLVLVYGGNVMKGYLGRDDLTRQVIRDGWYVTGDMGRMDEDGFITLTGRLSRFAKVGGEMVPLEKVEEELHRVLETSERLLAVTCVPDEARGERLVVLHVRLDGRDVRQMCQCLTGRGLPNLWIPAERDFFEVPELPILGSGKVHLMQLKEMALERARR